MVLTFGDVLVFLSYIVSIVFVDARKCSYFSFRYDIIAKSSAGLRPTSSGDMLRTGMPLTSSTRSPVWTEDSRSGLMTAESNLRENGNK